VKTPESTLLGWSHTRFWTVALALFILQAGLIWCFAEREHKPSLATPVALALRVLPRPMTQEQLATSLFAEDPTLFQAASLHGFSGRAWMQTPPPEYHAAEAPAPDVWLSLSNSGWFPRLRVPPAAKEQPLALAVPPATQFTPTPLPAASLSEDPGDAGVRIDGPLGLRRLVSPLPAPAPQPSVELLKNTVIQIAVDPSGEVMTACLTANSGSPAADAAALGLARRLRFAPVNAPGAAPDWGRVIFAWQTVEPAPASAPAAK
jgi:hypothetical protein